MLSPSARSYIVASCLRLLKALSDALGGVGPFFAILLSAIERKVADARSFFLGPLLRGSNLQNAFFEAGLNIFAGAVLRKRKFETSA